MSNTKQLIIDDELKNKYDVVTLSEAEFLTKLEVSRKQAEEGEYRDADEMITNIRSKYDL